MGIYHPTGHVLKQAVGPFRHVDQSVPYQVLHPCFQVFYTVQDVLMAFFLPFGLCCRIYRLFVPGFLLFLFGFCFPFGKPGGYPLRLFCLFEQVSLGGEQKQQPQSVFTREFPAGTGAFESNVIQVDGGLVRIFSAALAVSPYGAFTAGKQDPFPGTASPLPAFTEAASGASCMICSSVRFNGIRFERFGVRLVR